MAAAERPAAAGPAGSCSAIEVAAGVIVGKDERILLARRAEHLHQGGLWEFPGGKLEPGETPEDALIRELREELDLVVTAPSPLIRLRHDYPDRRVRLHVFRVRAFEGVPRGLQGQPLAWVEAGALPNYPFPAANRPIVAAARLPDHYAILEPPSAKLAVAADMLRRLAANGITLVRLRANGLAASAYAALAEALAETARSIGIGLLLSGDPELVRRTGAAGLHLKAEQLRGLDSRPLEAGFWLAASCHDALELQQAGRAGVDFAVLGPVRATASHPGAEPLGWAAFAALTEAAAFPVYALGGLGFGDTAEAHRHGAQGVAAIRGFLERDAPAWCADG